MSKLFSAINDVLLESEYTIVESADVPDKLIRDAQSLKRAGWKIDKVKHHLLTHGDYDGVKVTSDMIDSILKPKKTPAAPKAPKEKPWSAPKNPSASQKNNWQHAETFAATWSHPDAAAEGGGDLGYGELWDVMSQAGYSDEAMKKALSNLGIEDNRRRPAAKKAPKRLEEAVAEVLAEDDLKFNVSADGKVPVKIYKGYTIYPLESGNFNVNTKEGVKWKTHITVSSYKKAKDWIDDVK